MGKKNFFRSMFSDESGDISSKRILGTLCVLCILFVLVCGCYIKDLKPDANLIDAVTYIAIALIFATSSDKAMKYFNAHKAKTKKSEEDGNSH